MSQVRGGQIAQQKIQGGKVNLKAQEEARATVETPSKRRYASLADSNKFRKTLLDKYSTGIELPIELEIKAQTSKNNNGTQQVKPPHRIPRIAAQQSSELSEARYMAQGSKTLALNSPTHGSPIRGGNDVFSDQVQSPTANRGQKKIDAASGEKELEGGSLHLVPCRWSLSGWKYVKVDPQEHKYFSNPHRVNGQGIYTGHQSPANKKKTALLGGDHSSFDQRQWMGEGANHQAEELGTTYGKFFSPSKLHESKDMQKKRFEYRNSMGKTAIQGANNESAMSEQPSQGQFPPYHQKNFYGSTINWAGGLHYRSNFNKTRDYLGDWTNVLFRN